MSKTPRTPRSRTPSRVGAPIVIGPSPARLIPPNSHSAPSVSSFRVYSHGNSAVPTPLSSSPPQAASSSSSSTIYTEPTRGVLIQEPDAEVDTIDGEQGTVTGHIESSIPDEEARKSLRDNLRKAITEDTQAGANKRAQRQKHRSLDVGVLQPPGAADSYPPRQYFVLTDAGKPVFISRKEDEDSDTLTSVIGLMQALISVFLDDGDKIRCINAGKTRITFTLRPPLYYVCVSAWGEPESVTRFHLEYLHLQILSVIPAEQLRRMFERRNFDLRRLLSGAENLFHSLLSRMEWDLAMSSSSLYCLKLEPALRKAIADVLVPTSKIKDILYVILVAQERVVTLVRPKKHSIHPSDLHILINTIHAPSILNNSASASWLPICLPKFNPTGFVYAYVTFVRRGLEELGPSNTEDEGNTSDNASLSGSSVHTIGQASGDLPPSKESADAADPAPKIGLVCVSGVSDFDSVKAWCETVVERMEREGLLESLESSIRESGTTYSVSDLSIPGLRHFLYKSRPHVQVTMPEFEDPYDDLNEKRRLVTLYQILHDAIHAKSGQESTLKLQYIRTERESVLGWITQPFELYMALSPLIPKSAAINAANSITRWVQKEEKRLFLRDAPVF